MSIMGEIIRISRQEIHGKPLYHPLDFDAKKPNTQNKK